MRPRKKDDECEEECSRGRNRWFWPAILIIIGIWIIFEFGIKRIPDLPKWVGDIEFIWVIPILIGVAIIIAAISALQKSGGQRL
jgi:hypothetical protein